MGLYGCGAIGCTAPNLFCRGTRREKDDVHEEGWTFCVMFCDERADRRPLNDAVAELLSACAAAERLDDPCVLHFYTRLFFFFFGRGVLECG